MRDAAALLDRASLASLPIFPLPNCVLLPGGLMPLHVFEPRYRELTRDALAGDCLMGIARLKPGFEQSYYGKPPVYERFGVGKIICSEELDDGRFVLLLRGVGRAELERELGDGRTYRRVEARPLEDGIVDPIEANDHRRRLISLCDRLAEVIDQGGPQLRDLVRSVDDPGACADAVAAAAHHGCRRAAGAARSMLPGGPPAENRWATSRILLCELAPCTDTVN